MEKVVKYYRLIFYCFKGANAREENKMTAYVASTNANALGKYKIIFEVDELSGEVKLIYEDRNSVFPKPYMLLHLMDEVYMDVNPKLVEEGECAKWHTVRCNQPFKSMPTLEVGGKSYNLVNEVQATWLENNVDLAKLVRYFHRLKEDDVVYALAYDYNHPSYNFMNPENSPKWEFRRLK